MGSNTLARLGAVQRGKETYQFRRDQLLTVIDRGQWKHGKVPEARYSPDDPEMQKLVALIMDSGPRPVLAWEKPHPKTWAQRLMIISGNRTTVANEIANHQREMDGQPPRLLTVEVRKDLTEAQADELFASLNERQKPNDWLTRIQSAAKQVRDGVAESEVWDRWNFDSLRMMRQCIADGGILSACPELQTALASGLIPVKRAIRIAKLPLSEQLAALEGKREKTSHVPATVSMGKLKQVREALRDDKRLDGMTARDLLDILCGSAVVNEASLVVGQILVAKGKPGRKPQPKADGLTDAEREETQAFLDAEAKKREEEEAAQKGKV